MTKEKNLSGFDDKWANQHKFLRQSIIEDKKKEWRKITDRSEDVEKIIAAGRINNNEVIEYKNDFIGSLAKSFDVYGKLTNRQCSAVLRDIESQKALLFFAKISPNSQWVGKVGRVVSVKLTCNYIIAISGSFGDRFLHICADDQRNIVIYRGFSFAFPSKGETANVTAKVKEHEIRYGVKQTIITRPKVFV